MSDCVHENHRATVGVGRLFADDDHSGAPTGYIAEVHVECADCGEPFAFFGAGLPVGMTRDRPAISPDGLELRVPLRPQSSDPHLGLGLGGFVARLAEQDARGLN